MSEVKVEHPAEPPKKSSKTMAWVGSTYFAEGLPYSLTRLLPSIFFTDIGVSEREIGYLNALGLPWNFKFLWAPFVDSIGTKRRWMIVLQLAVALLTAGLAATCALSQGEGEFTRVVTTFAVILWAMAFLSATNDIAIDGYYLEALNKTDQAGYSGFRIMFYRFAVIFVRSGLVAIAAFAGKEAGGENKQLAWAYAFGAGALVLFALGIAHALRLAHVEQDRGAAARDPLEVLKSYGRAFVTYLKQERVGLVLLFILTYKLGDEILFSLNSTFLMRELSVTKQQMSWLGGIVGMSGAIGGAVFGGWWIKKRGFQKSIWPMTLLMNLTIWAYWWLAYSKPNAAEDGLWTIVPVHAYEFFAAGLGNAVLIVYLLRTCHPDHKAAHYAIGSALMSVGGTVVGTFSGRIVEAIGYANLYLLAFFASIPSMILLFFVPLKDEA